MLKINYRNKRTLADSNILSDPLGLKEGWKRDVYLLPDVGWPNIYIVNTLGEFTKDSLKVYKSLEAYTFFHSGRDKTAPTALII